MDYKYLKTLASDPLVWAPTVVSFAVLLAYHYYVNYYNYWRSRGVPGTRPFFMLSELYKLFFKDRAKLSIEHVKRYGKVYGSFFLGTPSFVIADPEVLRQIAIKDFDSFQNHYKNEFANKLQKNFLVWLQGDHWKRVRAMMSPQFTSGKIKRMYKLMDACADDLVDNFREQYISARRNGLSAATIDLTATYSMYTMDGITTCCYGLRLKREAGISAKDASNYKKASSRNSLVRDCNQIFSMPVGRILALGFVPRPILRLIGFESTPKSAYANLSKRVEQLIEKRRTTGDTNKYDDLLQMLVDAKLDDKLELNEMDQVENHHVGMTQEELIQDQDRLTSNLLNGHNNDKTTLTKNEANKLSDIEILSDALFLMAAGFDTTRSSMSTITYMLAHNPDVQERLHDELKKIVSFKPTAMGKHLVFDYEKLTSCQYLDAVISESLRIFAPVPFTDRQANADYFIEKYKIRVPKGSHLTFGIHAVQNDPDYWHEPDKFNPNRFMPGERDQIKPGTYMPFSMGPRHCIGMRFSLTETKLGLAKVLLNFKFEPESGTDYPPKPAFGFGLVRIKNPLVRVTLRDIDF